MPDESKIEPRGRWDLLSATGAAALERIAKDLFYPDRAYATILRRLAETDVASAELAAALSRSLRSAARLPM